MEFDTFGQESYTRWRDLILLWSSIIDAGFAQPDVFHRRLQLALGQREEDV